ncbi:hypothetical protein LCGC14_1372190 [marine sediment metagenome]|uniref:Uncharacterized protein n=1 Tax=marine sediment metagenome TaxID=412755 RepID=A0A0F9N728_9ZZZZ
MSMTIDKKGRKIQTSGFTGDLLLLELRCIRLRRKLSRYGLPLSEYTELKCITRDLRYARKLAS